MIWAEPERWSPEARRALADGQVALPELRGYPVVLNFWASWCEPCKDEAPELNASARAYAGRVVFLGIDAQDFRTDARRFLRRYAVVYPSVRESRDDTYAAYGLTGAVHQIARMGSSSRGQIGSRNARFGSAHS